MCWGIGIKPFLTEIAASFYMFNAFGDGVADVRSGKYFIEFEEEDLTTNMIYNDANYNIVFSSPFKFNRIAYKGPPPIETKETLQHIFNYEDSEHFDMRTYGYF